MAVKKPSPAIPEPSRQPDAAPPEATHESTQFRILKKGSCPTVSGKSYLNYELGADPNGSLFIRVTENSGGGFFNRDRISLKDIHQALGKGVVITAILLMPLYRQKSANSPAFLLAALIAEGIVRPMKGKTRIHELVPGSDFQARMDKLVASNVNLPDDLASTPAKVPAKPPAAKAIPKTSIKGKAKASTSKPAKKKA
jgi:hypothetical protein